MTSRAAQNCLAGRMQPVGHRLESPELDLWYSVTVNCIEHDLLDLKLSSQNIARRFWR